MSRGRPILGAVSGLFFGLFIALDLILLGTLALSSYVVVVFPILGLFVGLALGRWSPIRR
jgi:hypothetical protein